LKAEISKAKNIITKGLSRSHSRSNTREFSEKDSVSVISRNLTKESTKKATKEKEKVRMSFELVALLVYTVGVKCRGLNKKETYAPQHVFSLSERSANRILKQSVWDLVKHNRNHVVRIYPDGWRIGSTNYEPVRFWAAGCQLVSINWQTFGVSWN